MPKSNAALTIRQPRLSTKGQLQKVHRSWENHYNRSDAYRAQVQTLLEDMGLCDGIDWACIPDTWQELCASFDAVGRPLAFYTVAGVRTSPDKTIPTLYPLVTSGWDAHGRDIDCDAINLTVVAESNLWRSPSASLVMRVDARYPGMAVHSVPDEIMVQLF